MIDTQMSKGIIEFVILELVRRDKLYGYRIVEELKFYGFLSVSEGTVYPILTRLVKKGYIIGSLEKSFLGPKRKYYYITSSGRKYLQEFLENWNDMKNAIDNVFNNEAII